MENIIRYWRLLSKYLKSQWSQVLLLGILFITSIGLQLMIPQILRYFIDAAKAGETLKKLLNASGIFMGIAILQQLVGIGVTYTSQNIGWNATNALREDLAGHCLRLDMTFHKKHRPGEIIERIDGDVSVMFNFFSNLLVELIGHVLLMVGVLVLLYIESIYIGGAMTVFVIFSIIIMGYIKDLAIPFLAASREKRTNYFGFLGEVLTNIEDITSNGAVGKIIDTFRKSLRDWLPVRLKAGLVSFSMWTSTLLIFAIGNALAFGIGGVLWSKGLISVGTVYLIFHYTEMLSMPLRQIQRQLSDLQNAGTSIQRVEELFDIQSSIVSGGIELPTGPLGIEINRLVFEYEKDLPVLKDLSIQLEEGKVLGILGRTGSGKTTLARLLTRFYDPTEGEIKLQGQPIKEVSLDSLRMRVAFVPQDVQLFNATVRDNLTFFNPEIEDERIWQALREIGLEEWVGSLEDGLDTILKSDGGGLSAGEAQLLAFVRVFLKDPGLIILDEASSRLDPITEELIEGAISKLFRGRTGIIIAHRLQTLERADDLLILEKGCLAEYGSRGTLVEDANSYFSRLLQKGMKEVLS